MFNNIPQVTKNILILNILFFLATFVFQSKGIDLGQMLGAHYVNSPLFKPYQIITHFFMHGGFFHIFVNMWLFVMLGSFLERLWGPQRFFLFYIISALSAFALYNIIGVYQIELLKNELATTIPLDNLNALMANTDPSNLIHVLNQFMVENNLQLTTALDQYLSLSITPMVGASGAVFGVLAAFAILFPNTEFMIYFLFPVKAKYLVGAYFLFELYSAFQNNANDPVAHIAHIGGAIAGAILVYIWKKKDRANFY